RRGLASVGIDRAFEFFREQRDVDFALLVCGPHLLDYYRALGWREFAGRLWVRQHGATVEFTFNRVMTREVRSAAPQLRTIDLRGPPWGPPPAYPSWELGRAPRDRRRAAGAGPTRPPEPRLDLRQRGLDRCDARDHRSRALLPRDRREDGRPVAGRACRGHR